jgi:hypothetical protein
VDSIVSLEVGRYIGCPFMTQIQSRNLFDPILDELYMFDLILDV